MNNKETVKGLSFCFTVFFLMISQLCSAADYEIIDSQFPVANNARHEQDQWVTYNPINNDYMVILRVSGKKYGNCTDPDAYECNDCFHSIETVRLSPRGEVLGRTTISPPEGPLEGVSWKMMPRIAHNQIRNEYMTFYLKSPYVCANCHEGTPQEGNVDPEKCSVCHPLFDAGMCNLVAAHDAVPDADWAKVQDGDCQSCHTECAGGSLPITAPSPNHFAQCMTCHEKEAKHSWLHGWTLNTSTYTQRIDAFGEPLEEPKMLLQGKGKAAHPAITFNSIRKEYALVFNDRFIYSRWHNNIGFILDENGTVLKGPLRWDTGDQHHFVYDIKHNPINDTYMLNWEDFRDSEPPYYFWPDDIYGMIIDAEGSIFKDYAVIEDCGLPDMGDQWWPAWTLNTDKNEWLAMWVDKRKSLELSTGIMGRFFNTDGTYKGEPFLIIDGHRIENSQAAIYVPKEKKYFIVWQDARQYVVDPSTPWLGVNDIYGSWLDENGKPIGDEIPICVADGDQTIARLSYNPLMDQFLIAYWDTNTSEDYEVLDCENAMWAGPVDEGGTIAMPTMGYMLGDIKGTLYGKIPFLTVRVVEQATGNPVEGAWVFVVGRGLFKREATNSGGWCNLPKDGQSNGKYYVVAWNNGAITIEPVMYKGEPLQTTIAFK